MRWLVAASVLLAVGVGGSLLISTPRKAAASTDLVERLVDWNLDLTQAPSAADRSRIYSGQASALRAAVQKATLPEDDRELAESLLATAPWLTEHDDPLAEADRFNDMADKLMKRMSRATRGGDNRRAARYARLYRQVADRGIEAKVDTLRKSGSLNFEQQRRVERIILHDADRMNAVLALLEQAPDSTRKEIKQSLGITRKHPRKDASTQVTQPGTPSDARDGPRSEGTRRSHQRLRQAVALNESGRRSGSGNSRTCGSVVFRCVGVGDDVFEDHPHPIIGSTQESKP